MFFILIIINFQILQKCRMFASFPLIALLILRFGTFYRKENLKNIVLMKALFQFLVSSRMEHHLVFRLEWVSTTPAWMSKSFNILAIYWSFFLLLDLKCLLVVTCLMRRATYMFLTPSNLFVSWIKNPTLIPLVANTFVNKP